METIHNASQEPMEYIIKICKTCDKPFQAPVKQMFHKGKPHGKRCRINYCGIQCKSIALAKHAKLAVHEKKDRTPNVQCSACSKPLYRDARYLNSKYFWCSALCMGVLKAIEMQGNLHGAGLKQTPARIAHRVSFIMGEKNVLWRGGVTYAQGRSKKKYKYIKCPKGFEPMANTHGYVAEHRLVMAQMIGRLLLRQEVVHHIDSDTLNNHPDNLMLFPNNAAHKSHEHAMGLHRCTTPHLQAV